MNFIKKRRKLVAYTIAFIFVLMLIPILNYGKAFGDVIQTKKPVLAITGPDITKTAGKVYEDITVTYHVQPQPLAIGDVNVISNKEIVLVLDTSGSMADQLGNTTRIAALRTAANHFIERFASVDNVKIGIVTYSNKANNDGNSIGLTSSKSTSTLEDKINRLSPNGATNIGDGIRSALKMLNNTDNAKKYVVLMSDGEPTQYTYYNKWVQDWLIFGHNEKLYYTNLDNDGTQLYDGGGNSDPDGKSLEYANTMAGQIKNSNYSSYEIAYSDGSSATKMNQIAIASGGTAYSATSAGAIDAVYSSIADSIRADYSVENVNFNFTIPSNLEFRGSNLNVSINGSNYTQRLGNISYRLNSTGTGYVADPFDVYFYFRANKSGSYTLGQNWSISYKATDGTTATQTLPTVQYTASNMSIGFNLQRNLPGYSDHIKVNQQQEVDYVITPQPISMTYKRKPKEIAIVVDSAYSRKDNITSFIDQFAGATDVKFALVTYGQGASITNFGGATTPTYFLSASNSGALKNAVSAISNQSGANLGDGLRKAMYVLNDGNDVSRSIIVFGQNNPNYYSYTTASDGSQAYYEVLDNSSPGTSDAGTNPLMYGNDANQAANYATDMANKIRNDKISNIATLCAGDGTNDDVIKSVASICGTDFNNLASSQDISYLYNVMNSDLILNGSVEETLPGGIQYNDGTTTSSKSIKIFYNYNSSSATYIGSPKTITSNIQATQLGNFDLNNCALKYNDLEGLSLSTNFASISLKVLNDYSIAQGIFMPNKTTTASSGIIGESYILNSTNNYGTTSGALTSVGALIKTSGQQTNVVINLNSTNMTNFYLDYHYGVNVDLYKVNSNNTLSKVNGSSMHLDTTISTNSTNDYDKSQKNISITVPIAASATFADTYYIINYTYKNGYNGTVPSTGVTVYDNCKIGTSASQDFQYNIGALPDLF